jgi:hypothetical protein
MTDNRGADVEATAGRVADKLKKVREASADLPEGDRRDAFRRTLDDELGKFPGQDADRILTSIKDRFVDEARQTESRVGELEKQTEALAAQLQAVSTERDRLREEIERLRDQPSSTPSAAPPAAVAGSGGDLGKVREGLMRVSRGEEVTSESSILRNSSRAAATGTDRKRPCSAQRPTTSSARRVGARGRRILFVCVPAGKSLRASTRRGRCARTA